MNEYNCSKNQEDLDLLEEDSIEYDNPDQQADISDGQEGDRSQYKQGIKSSKQAQQKLVKYAELIPLMIENPIDKKDYPQYFKYLIYESYKPKNLLETRKLMQLFLNHSMGNDKEYYQEFSNYLKKDIDTKLPNFINQKNLLQFDSNFECGNLDSAYLASENVYNLLMKVDTNTKGNTFWFYFRVSNIRPGNTVEFNVINFSRDVKHFYQYGMKVFSKRDDHDWEHDKCFDVMFSPNPDLVKMPTNSGKTSGSKYFYQLTFKYTFEQCDQQQLGSYVQFAYTIPYSYSDLLQDLDIAKNRLLSLSGQIRYLGANDITVRNSQQLELIDSKQQERHRLTQFELQHLEIKNLGLRLMKLNPIEKALLNETNQNDLDSYQQQMDINQKFQNLEYEIKTDNIIYKQEIISTSVGGLPQLMITLTSRCISGNQLKFKKRKVILISARVHAGETSGSFIMRSIIHELTQSDPKYDQLLQNYIIKLVPMINPDGVAIGNSRTSLMGLDLNRRWTQPNPIIHPEVFFLKRQMKKINSQYEKGIQIFCDLHGHNRKMNSFVYGCHKAANSGLLSWTKTRLLPKILAKITPLFTYKDCRFKIDKCKLNTARVVCWNELKITNSFTLEASMFGKSEITSENEKSYSLFNNEDFNQLGVSILMSILQYHNLEPELEYEFQQTNGWLKVSKLNDVTGRPVNDKLNDKKSSILTNTERKKNQSAIASKQIRHRKSFIEGSTQNKLQSQQSMNQQSQNQNSQGNQGAQQNVQTLKRKQSFLNTNNQGVSKLRQSNNNIKNELQYSKLQNSSKTRKFFSNKNMIKFSKSGSSINDSDTESNKQSSSTFCQQNWKDFFEPKELDKVIQMAKQNQIIEEENEDSVSDNSQKLESDSDPSEDNIDQKEFLQIMNSAFEMEDQNLIEELIPDYRNQLFENMLIESKEFTNQPLSKNSVHQMQESPPYNFKSKKSSNIDPYYDIELLRQNQSNRIKILQEQLEELEKQKLVNLGIQKQQTQVVGMAPSLSVQEKQIQITTSNQKNPVIQASNTMYAGWSQSKHKSTNSNNASNNNSASNFNSRADQISADKINQIMKMHKLRSGSRKKTASNLFDPTKQKVVVDIAGGMVRLNDLSKNIFAQQLQQQQQLSQNSQISPLRLQQQPMFTLRMNSHMGEDSHVSNGVQILSNKKYLINTNNKNITKLSEVGADSNIFLVNTGNKYQTQSNFFQSFKQNNIQIEQSRDAIGNSPLKYNEAQILRKSTNNYISSQHNESQHQEIKTLANSTISPSMFKRIDQWKNITNKQATNVQSTQLQQQQQTSYQSTIVDTNSKLPQIMLNRVQTTQNNLKRPTHIDSKQTQNPKSNITNNKHNMSFYAESQREPIINQNLNKSAIVPNRSQLPDNHEQLSAKIQSIYQHERPQKVDKNQIYALINASKFDHNTSSDQGYSGDGGAAYRKYETQIIEGNSLAKNQKNVFLQSLIKSNRRQMPTLAEYKNKQ